MTVDDIYLGYLGHHDTWEGGILRDDVINQPEMPSTQRSLTPDNFDVTDAIRKGRRSNLGEHTRIVTLYINLLNLFSFSCRSFVSCGSGSSHCDGHGCETARCFDYWLLELKDVCPKTDYR
jgi:hypothetical protein